MAPLTFAFVDRGGVLHITFTSIDARERLRGIVAAEPRPHPDSDDQGDNDENDAEADGLDPFKTYSKEETLQNPHVEFVHRGQGRYRMANAIKNEISATLPRPRR